MTTLMLLATVGFVLAIFVTATNVVDFVVVFVP
jgi:hypothetical protein